MLRRYQKIYSPAIGKEMEILAFGHAGIPFIGFTNNGGQFYEFEDNGMIDVLANLIDDGEIRLYTVGNIDPETWYHTGLDPHWRGVRHSAYQDFVLNNLVPYIRYDAKSEDGIGLVGVDFGAFHAVNFALKYPRIFTYALGMSGRYDLDKVCGRLSESLEVYYNNPMAYVSNLSGQELKKVRKHTHLALVSGQGHWDTTSYDETTRLGELLEKAKIPHEVDLWGNDVEPDWYWWQKQIVHHIEIRLEQLQDKDKK
ncbi:MAG: alpha/beta hydrolase-fold protein [Chloroflexota bacterium]